MYPFKSFFALILLFDQSFFLAVLGQGRIEINTESDIPSNGHWEFDCPKGYANYTNDFDCGEYSGKVTVPPEDLNEQIGFWTVCLDLCRIKYAVQDQDTSFAARMYQKNLLTEIVFDGTIVEFIEGKKWVDIYVNLEGSKHNEISLRFDHFSENYFTLLDKIVINGELDPPSTHFPTSTLGSTPTITTEEDDASSITASNSIPSSYTTSSTPFIESTFSESTILYTTSDRTTYEPSTTTSTTTITLTEDYTSGKTTSEFDDGSVKTTSFSTTSFMSTSPESSSTPLIETSTTESASSSSIIGSSTLSYTTNLPSTESLVSSISTNTESSYFPTSLSTPVLTESSSASTLHTSVPASQSTEGPQPPRNPSPHPPSKSENHSFKEPLVFVISSLSSLFFVSVLFICVFMHPFFKKRNRRKDGNELEAAIS